MCRQSVCEQRQPKKLLMFGKFYCHDIVTQELLRYTFPDVISNRFRAKLTHTADAALVASALYINWLECFSSFFPLKTEWFFLRL